MHEFYGHSVRSGGKRDATSFEITGVTVIYSQYIMPYTKYRLTYIIGVYTDESKF